MHKTHMCSFRGRLFISVNTTIFIPHHHSHYIASHCIVKFQFLDERLLIC